MPFKFNQETIDEIDRQIIPCIINGARDALAALQVSLSENGDRNYCGNYSLGCTVYENILNRIQEAIDNSTFFSYYFKNNVLEVHITQGVSKISLQCCRVDAKTRLPTNSGSTKLKAQQQYFLSEAIEAIGVKHGTYIIGYDIDPERGLGDITLQRLICTDGKNYSTEILYVFHEAQRQIVPETIATPTVVRVDIAGLAKLSDQDTTPVSFTGDGMPSVTRTSPRKQTAQNN